MVPLCSSPPSSSSVVWGLAGGLGIGRERETVESACRSLRGVVAGGWGGGGGGVRSQRGAEGNSLSIR